MKHQALDVKCYCAFHTCACIALLCEDVRSSALFIGIALRWFAINLSGGHIACFQKAPTLLFARMLLGVCFANAAKDETMLIFRAFSFFEKAWEVHLINGLEVVVMSVYVDIDGP